jgi:hypothetical protein
MWFGIILTGFFILGEVVATASVIDTHPAALLPLVFAALAALFCLFTVLVGVAYVLLAVDIGRRLRSIERKTPD